MNGSILWANLHLLFWLSLVPFVTGWMGENHFAAWPVALYGVVLLMAGLAYVLLSKTLIAFHGQDSPLGIAVGRDYKGKLSLVIYVIAVALCVVDARLSLALYFLVAAIWFLPDRGIEGKLADEDH